MTPVEFVTRVRFMTRTNSTTFADEDVKALMKVRQDELAKDIIDVDEDILLIPQYEDLVANQREYSLPSDMLSGFKRVEAKLDGTNYIKLKEFDPTTYNRTLNSETDIVSNFSNLQGNACFDLMRKSIVIYSGTISDVTAGLKILVNTWPTPVTDLTSVIDMSVDPSSTTHGIPRELHEIWCRGVIIDWKSSREKPVPLTEQELSYKMDKQIAINSLKPQNRDRVFVAKVPYLTGYEY